MSAPLSIYYKKFEKQLELLKTEFVERKPELLLHACCGPCSSAVLELLHEYFRITIYYYNPNIYPEAEYIRRRDELMRFVPLFMCESDIPVIEEAYNPEDFFEAIKCVQGYEKEPEKGERCRACYEFRMKKAALYAYEHKFDFFTTTLSISPHKDAAKINDIGEALQKQYSQSSLKYLYADFKKKNGFKRSLEISALYGLYRQDYCGCIFSKNNSHV